MTVYYTKMREILCKIGMVNKMNNKKIKVLHLELDEHLGGIESFLYNLYNAIDREKVQFDFVSRSDNPAYKSELTELGANIFKVYSFKNPFKYMNDLKQIIKNGEYDIIHIHKNSAANILPFCVTNKFKNMKVFVHSHNTKPSVNGCTSVLHNINKKFLYDSANKHFACSQVAGEWMYGKNIKFRVLRNGIITSKYRFNKEKRKIKRQELNIPNSAFVVGNVGRFAEQKNQKRLVEVFDEVKKLNPNSYLLLIGDGNLKEKIQLYVKEKNIENVKFLGVRNDIPDLMMAMDVFVMPSLYEGLPIVGVEAQAAGLNLYLSNTISKETQLIDSVKWFDLNESNKRIAESIKIEMIDDEERKCGNDDVKNHGYDIEQTAKELLYEYEECLR